MPATYIQNQGNPAFRQRVQFNLSSFSESLHRDAHRADNARDESKKVSSDLSLLEGENRQFVTSSSSKITRYYVTAVIILAVYIIDTLLFGGVATLLAKSAFPDNDAMHYLVKFITPLAFLAIEIYLALLIYEKSQKRAQIGQNNSRMNLWIILGIIFALVMPALVISSHPDTVRLINSSESLAALLTTRLIGLTIVAFTVHAIVIFSGGHATEAKAFLLYRSKHKKLENQIQNLNRDFEQCYQSVINNYNAYSLELETYNQQFPNMRISPLNFDTVTRNFIRECLTGETGSDAAANTNQNQNRADSDVQPNAADPNLNYANNHADNGFELNQPNQNGNQSESDSADGENEYLRSVLTRNIKDADDEVK
ncbi:MAG TPA: hypothetical protein VK892_17365 [Pyrinomonadaceae bacterium]|nr:hypothetical protein [Pyrinomonadaceae bacterium]